MKNKIKKELKNIFISLEEKIGFAAGFCACAIPPFGDVLFRSTVAGMRRLPDRWYLILAPFLGEFGRALYNMRGEKRMPVHLINGARMEVDISEVTQRQIYVNKIFEAGLTRYLLSVLREGDVVVDVGANVGYFTMLTAKIVGPKGRVISIEPEFRNLEALKENIKINDFQNVTVCACAVGRKESTQVLNINPLNRGGNSLIPFVEYKSGGVKYPTEEIVEKFGEEKLFQKVLVRTLDAVAKENNLGAIAFMKMDVEGFEYDALMGARELLKERKIQRIVCEISNKNTRDAALALFRESLYTSYAISFSGEPVMLTEEGGKKYPRDILFVSSEL